VIFRQTPLAGAFVVEPDRAGDDICAAFRTFVVEEFRERSLCTSWVDSTALFNAKAGVLHGMHYRDAAEVRLVRATQGAVFDVIIDLRRQSPTLGRWFGIELSAANRKALYVPEGFAQGYQTLADNTELLCHSSIAQSSPCRGVRWDDPAFAIAWPQAPTRTLSARDRHYPDFRV
jgi:dTDP-4-dehydrorhamnose 3,5-epimerase